MSMMLPDDPFDDTATDRYYRLSEAMMELDRQQKRNDFIMAIAVIVFILSIIFLAS